MHTDTSLLRRSNGRPQACDQCRQRKVACDHAQPTCSRCRKRKQTCVYTISDSRPKRPRPRSVSHSSSTSTSTPTPAGVGYLGFTSHNAVFQEARTSLSLVHGPDLGPDCRVNDVPRRPPKVRPRVEELPPHLRYMALFVLKNLPGPEFEHAEYRFACRPDDWIIASIKRIIRALYNVFNEHLTGRADTQLEEMALTISNNTSRQFRDEVSCAETWLSQYVGPNIRWESLGLIWTIWGVINNDDLLLVRSCVGYCIELARHFTDGNSLLFYLCYRKATIDSLIHGDASSACWISHGESIAMLTFLGFHAESNSSSYHPSLASENRRRLFAKTFNIDKVMVSFTGRPPLLGRRYSSTPLPLDLSDNDLIAGGETLDRAIQDLDEAGWSRTAKNVGSATLIRARAIMAYLKDEILEIALGPASKVSLSDLRNIKTRQERTMAGFPDRLIYHEGDLEDRRLNLEDLYARILVRLEHLQNLFFLERLMLRHGHPDDGRLLTISFEMVTLTQVFWTHQDRFTSIRRDLEWLLMAYAAPGGGILCLELLRPTFHGVHPDCPQLSRSTIIQTLSLLIGFLDWVRPAAPNADLCCDCKAIIQGVLDHNLNAPAGGAGALDTLDWEFPMQLDFNFDLLDTFGWLRPE